MAWWRKVGVGGGRVEVVIGWRQVEESGKIEDEREWKQVKEE